MMVAVSTKAQTEETYDLSVSSASYPRACALKEQPVIVTVRNAGQTTVSSFTVGVMKDGEKLFDEHFTEELAKWKSTQLELSQKVEMTYGQKDTVTVYVDVDGTDTNLANDTMDIVVDMPQLRSFPYEWDAATAGDEYTVNKWLFDPDRSAFYIDGKGTNWKNSALRTPAIQFADDQDVTCRFKYHVGSASVTLSVYLDYGLTRDTVYAELLPQTTTADMADYSVNFKAKGLCQVVFSAATSPMSYDEIVMSDISFGEAVPDMAATKIISPQVSRLVRTAEGYPLTVRYTNPSTFDIANPTLAYSANGTEVKETYEGTLAAGDTLDYTFATPLPATADSIDVVAWCEADDNAANDTISATYGFYDALSFPYITTFDEGTANWQAIDADGDGNTWTFSTLDATGGCAYYPSSSSTDAVDYLLTPAINMPAGRSRISFYYSGFMKAGTESLAVLMGTTPNPEQMAALDFDQDLTNNGWLNGFSLIDLDAAGTYYFAFRAKGYGDRIYLDNLYIDQDEDLCINDATFDTESGYGKTTANVTLSYINHGVSAQKDVALRYYINDQLAAEEVCHESVEPGDTVYYTFEHPADISTPDSTYQLKGEIATVLGPDQNNDVILGQSVSCWPVQTLPYSYGFDDTGRNGYWLMQSDAEDGKTGWKFYSASNNAYSPKMVLSHYGKVAEGVNDYAFSECLSMTKGTYEVSFFYRTNVNGNNAKNTQFFSLSIGDDRTPEAMTTEIASIDSVLVYSPFYKKFTGTIDIAADGQYFLGFRCTTPACNGSSYLYIDDLEIKPVAEGLPLPYNADLAGEWTRYNTKTTNAHWEEYTEADDSQVMRAERNSTHAQMNYGFEDKLVSPKLRLDAGQDVIVTVEYALSSDSTNTALNMYAGHADNPDSLLLVAALPVVADSAYTAYEYKFTATEADSCFFLGFRTNSPEVLSSGYIYDARIKSVTVDYDATTAIGLLGNTDAAISVTAAGGRLHVSASQPIQSVSVCDTMGRSVVALRPGQNALTLDCHSLHGIYIVRVSTADATTVRKLTF